MTVTTDCTFSSKCGTTINIHLETSSHLDEHKIVFDSGEGLDGGKKYSSAAPTSSQEAETDEDCEDLRPLVIDTEATTPTIEKSFSRQSSHHSTKDIPLSFSDYHSQGHPLYIDNGRTHVIPGPEPIHHMVPTQDRLRTIPTPEPLTHIRPPHLTPNSSAENLSVIYTPSSTNNMVMGSNIYNFLTPPSLTPSSGSSSNNSSMNSAAPTPLNGKGSAPSKARKKTDKILPLASGVDGEKYICPVCQKLLMSMHELTKHIRTHNSASVAANCCTICGKQLSSQSSLDRHMLVHSGERPFKCRICKMSFTTNGNMHRHMRIHEKEAETPLPTNGVDPSGMHTKSIAKRSRGKDDITSPSLHMSMPSSMLTPASLTSSPHPIIDSRRSLLPLPMMPPDIGSSSKRKLSFSEMEDSFYLPHKRQAMMAMEMSRNSMPSPSMMSPPVVVVTKTREAMYSMDAPLMSTPKVNMEPKMDSEMSSINNEETELQCPICGKSFLCKYGLETHMETHPAHTLRCLPCNLSFPDARSLQLHHVMMHTPLNSARNASTARDDSETDKKDLSSKSPPGIGFHELSFMDCTMDKFPLVARAWCEENPRRPSSIFHNFTCNECDKSFPCQSSLDMHKASHTDEFSTSCKVCNCHFSNAKELREHSLQHVASNVVGSISNKDLDEDDESVVREKISKEEFLAVMDLKVSREQAKSAPPPEAPPERRHANEWAMRSDYYMRLGQAAFYPSQMHKMPENYNFPSMNQFLAHQRALSSQQQLVLPPGMHMSNPMISPLVAMKSESDSLIEKMKAENLANGYGEEVFHCKFCNESFTNYRAFRGHERTHLGLTPFRCDKCPYQSADRSTLIRHSRTHNGERPFQCRICEFAFTTKANCERHVRKRHACNTRDEIEKAIGFTQFPSATVMEDASNLDDTICKFCGDDFQSYAALKYHLRSHTSCKYKPYVCKICQNGFSSKPNCLRHIQKQHPEIEVTKWDSVIHLNESLLDNTGVESPSLPNSAPTSRAASPAPVSHASIMNHHGNKTIGMHLPVMPPQPAHIKSASAIISATEKEACDVDQPLDLCTKSSKEASKEMQQLEVMLRQQMQQQEEARKGNENESEPATAEVAEQPVDLTTHRRMGDVDGSTVPPTQSAPARPIPLHPQEVGFSEHQIHPAFGRPVLAQTLAKSQPVAKNRSQSPAQLASRSPVQPIVIQPRSRSGSPTMRSESPASNHGNSRPSSSDHVKAQIQQMVLSNSSPASATTTSTAATTLTSNSHLVNRYKKEYQKYYNPMLQVHIRSHTNERPYTCTHCDAGFTIKTNLDRHLKTRHPQLCSDDVSATSPAAKSDASPVPQTDAVTTTESNNNGPATKPCLIQCTPTPKSPANGYASDSSSDLASVTRILANAKLQTFPNLPSQNVSMDSSEGHHDEEEEDAQNEDEYDEDEEQQIAQEEAEDAAAANAESHLIPTTLEITQNPSEEIHVPVPSTPPKTNSQTSLSPGPAGSGDGVVKKKRNSYADSPHKLVCPFCPRAFPWVSSLNRHILTHTGQKPFKCPQCPVMFSTKSNRERHLVRKHGLNVLDPATRQMMDRPFKCHLCIFSSFSTSGNLLKHYREKHPDVEMPAHLLLPSSEHGDNYDHMGDNCSGGSENSMDGHKMEMENEAYEEEEEEGEMIKDGLGKKLLEYSATTLAMYDSGMRMQRDTSTPPTDGGTPCSTPPSTPEDQTNPERDNYNVDKITTCWKCGENFISRKILLRHLKEHNIDLPYKCYLCDGSFETRLESLSHKATAHSPDWVVLQDKNHVSSIEEFSDCMDKLVEQNFLEEAPKDDTIIDLAFQKFKVNLQADDLHPESDYSHRRVYCTLCPKRFWSLQDLRRHMRSHTGERPFKCDMCDKRFTLKHSMMRHRRKHDLGDSAASLSASEDESGEFSRPNRPSSRSSWQVDVSKIIGSPASLDHAALRRRLPSGDGDLLGNLLGVQNSDMDQLLDSADSAAKVLGVKN